MQFHPAPSLELMQSARVQAPCGRQDLFRALLIPGQVQAGSQRQQDKLQSARLALTMSQSPAATVAPALVQKHSP